MVLVLLFQRIFCSQYDGNSDLKFVKSKRMLLSYRENVTILCGMIQILFTPDNAAKKLVTFNL